MTTEIYRALPNRLGLGDLDVLEDDLRVVLLTAAYVFDVDHATLADIDAGARSAETLADLDSKAWTDDGAQFRLTADPATIPTTPIGDVITQAVLYKKGATELESYLIARYSGTGFPFTTGGGSVTITWNSSGQVFGLGGTATPTSEDEVSFTYTGQSTSATPVTLSHTLEANKNYSIKSTVMVSHPSDATKGGHDIQELSVRTSGANITINDYAGIAPAGLDNIDAVGSVAYTSSGLDLQMVYTGEAAKTRDLEWFVTPKEMSA